MDLLCFASAEHALLKCEVWNFFFFIVVSVCGYLAEAGAVKEKVLNMKKTSTSLHGYNFHLFALVLWCDQ